MPYQHFRLMADEDLASVIVYIRSIPPVHKALPPTEIIFPVKYLIHSLTQPITQPVPQPDITNTLERGKYLVTIAGMQRLPYTAVQRRGYSRAGIRRWIHFGRPLGQGRQPQYYAGPVGDFLLR